METAVNRLVRGAYQIGTGGGVRGWQVNSSPATYSIQDVNLQTFYTEDDRRMA